MLKTKLSLFKINTTENYSKPARVNNGMEVEKTRENQKEKKNQKTKKIRAIEGRIIRDIKSLFEQEEEDYYKPLRVGNFYSDNYIKYESTGNKN